jgi:hypothetical protein
MIVGREGREGGRCHAHEKYEKYSIQNTKTKD